MESAEKFCLRWNDFENNISGAFRELREDKDFFDVTLACDEDQIQAHKVIISACSPFFKSILRRNRHEHPLLYLKGVKYADLVSILNFMYHGEVNVAQEELNSFLAVAEELKVKGLTQNSSDTKTLSARGENCRQKIKKTLEPAEPTPPPKRPRPAPLPPQPSRPVVPTYTQRDDDIQEVVPVKSEPATLPPEPDHTALAQQDTTYTAVSHGGGMVEYGEDYGDYGDYEQADGGYDGAGMDGNKELEEMMEPHILFDPMYDSSKPWQCTQCQKSFKQKCHVRDHIEGSHMIGLSFSCPYCNQSIGSRHRLRTHISNKHNIEHKEKQIKISLIQPIYST